MRRPKRALATPIAVAVASAALLAPAFARAAEDVSAAPPLVRERWYDGPLRGFDQAFDLLVVRPCAAVTLLTGAGIFVGAAILTAPNGIEGINDAYDRFVREPYEYFSTRPLGEF